MLNPQGESEYIANLELEILHSSHQLKASIPLLKNTVNYSQLLKLNVEILELLVKHETARVDLLESLDPSIIYRASGHHRDKLDIFKDALNQKPVPSGIHIYMSDDGTFEFSLHDCINPSE